MLEMQLQFLSLYATCDLNTILRAVGTILPFGILFSFSLSRVHIPTLVPILSFPQIIVRCSALLLLWNYWTGYVSDS